MINDSSKIKTARKKHICTKLLFIYAAGTEVLARVYVEVDQLLQLNVMKQKSELSGNSENFW